MDNKDTNDMQEIWKKMFLQVFDKHAPLQNKKYPELQVK